MDAGFGVCQHQQRIAVLTPCKRELLELWERKFVGCMSESCAEAEANAETVSNGAK